MTSSSRVRRFGPSFLGVLGTASIIYAFVAAIQPSSPLPWLSPQIAFLLALALGLVGAPLAAMRVYRGMRAPRAETGDVNREHKRGPGTLDLAALWLYTAALIGCMALDITGIGPFLAPVALVALVVAAIATWRRSRSYQ